MYSLQFFAIYEKCLPKNTRLETRKKINTYIIWARVARSLLLERDFIINLNAIIYDEKLVCFE